MNRITIFTILSLIGMTVVGSVGCGSAESDQLGLNTSESCDFQLSSFMNGPNSQEATTFWNCTEGGRSNDLVVFADGTGASELNGAFTWRQTGCRSVSYDGGSVSGEITDINGSIESGILTAKDHYNGQTYNASCVLRNLN